MPFPDFTPAIAALCAIFAIAGIVRGFSGFGTGLIAVPLGAIFVPVETVIIAILVADTVPMLPLIRQALNHVALRPLMSVYAGYLVAMPAGIWFLIHADPVWLRWFISAVVFSACALLWSGWRYRGPRNLAVRAGIGSLSGFLGGSTGMNGPPVILYWMAQEDRARQVRANLIIFFALTELAGFAFFWWMGLLTAERLMAGVIVAPFYFIGLMIGARLFGRSSDSGYRRFAFLLILAAAVLALPVWDGMRG
jgi:uncharacterized membrane protein YfcA